MILRRATGTDKSVKERKGLKRKFAAYAGLTLGLILTAGLFAGCGKKDTAESGNATVLWMKFVQPTPRSIQM